MTYNYIQQIPPEARSIPGFRECFACPDGRVISICGKRPLVLRPRKTSDGYHQVGVISPEGRRVSQLVHRLVALTFLAGDPALTVDHINGDRTDNREENLRWLPRADNVRAALLRHPLRPQNISASLSQPVVGISPKGERIEFSSRVAAAIALRGCPNGSRICYAVKHGTSAYGYKWINLQK